MLRAVASRLKAAVNALGGFGGLSDASGNKLPIPYAISEGNLPIGIPSSGTIGNNGALSGLTAFNTTFAGIYLYFPANSIVVGQPAGLYYTVMASATAGTIYNNQYLLGDPMVPPAVLVPFATIGPGAYTQTTGVDVTLRAIPIASNSMGINGSIRVTGTYSVPINANVKTPKFIFGGAVFSGGSIPLSSTPGGQICRTISNRATNSQIAYGISSLISYAGGTIQYYSVDTTTNIVMSLTGLIAVATDWLVLESGLMEVFPT